MRKVKIAAGAAPVGWPEGEVSDECHGEHVQMRCWEDSQSYDGTNRWFIVMAPNADLGWVSADMVANQTIVGHC